MRRPRARWASGSRPGCCCKRIRSSTDSPFESRSWTSVRDVHPDLRRGGESERDALTVTVRRDGAGPRRDLDDLQPPAGSHVVLPEVLEEALVRLRLLGDALDHDRGAL